MGVFLRTRQIRRIHRAFQAWMACLGLAALALPAPSIAMQGDGPTLRRCLLGAAGIDPGRLPDEAALKRMDGPKEALARRRRAKYGILLSDDEHERLLREAALSPSKPSNAPGVGPLELLLSDFTQLTRAVVAKYQRLNPYIPEEDLMQETSLLLRNALANYDAAKGRPIYYVTRLINDCARDAVKNYVREKYGYGTTQFEISLFWNRGKIQERLPPGKTLTPEEFAEAYNAFLAERLLRERGLPDTPLNRREVLAGHNAVATPEKVIKAFEKLRKDAPPFSLPAVAIPTEADLPRTATLFDEDLGGAARPTAILVSSSPEEELLDALQDRDTRKRLETFRKSLSPNELYVLDHALLAEKKQTLKQIGAELTPSSDPGRKGVSTTTVMKIRDDLRQRLRLVLSPGSEDGRPPGDEDPELLERWVGRLARDPRFAARARALDLGEDLRLKFILEKGLLSAGKPMTIEAMARELPPRPRGSQGPTSPSKGASWKTVRTLKNDLLRRIRGELSDWFVGPPPPAPGHGPVPAPAPPPAPPPRARPKLGPQRSVRVMLKALPRAEGSQRLEAFLALLSPEERIILEKNLLATDPVVIEKLAPLLGRRADGTPWSRRAVIALREELKDKAYAAFTGEQESGLEAAAASLADIESEVRELAEFPRFREKLLSLKLEDPRMDALLKHDLLASEPDRKSLEEIRQELHEKDESAVPRLKNQLLRRIRADFRDLFD